MWDGLDFLPMVIGMFGVVEIIRNLEQPDVERSAISARFRDLWPSMKDFHESWRPVIRGTFLGAILGILPGGGVVLASFAAYTLEKKIAKDPSRFGKGAIEGVAGPESANNCGGADLVHSAAHPRPAVQRHHGVDDGRDDDPGYSARLSGDDQPARPVLGSGRQSMWIGNLMLVIINLPMIGIWVKLLSLPYRFLYPAILLFCVIGVYSTNNNSVLMVFTAGFALFGYILVRLGCEPAPMILGFILGPLMEENLRRSLVLSRGDPMIFVQRPISAILLVLSACVVALIVLPALRKTREEAFQE